MDSTRRQRLIGWILSALVSLFLLGPSAMGKFTAWEGKEAMFTSLGYTVPLLMKIGVVEVAVAVLFLIPQTALIGAILVTAYLGGATATHVRVGQPFWMPILLGVVVWVGLGLRRPVLRELLRAK
jgi:DoxX-like family